MEIDLDRYKSSFAYRGTPPRKGRNLIRVELDEIDKDTGKNKFYMQTRGERKRIKRRESNMRTLGINSMPNELISDKYLHSFARKYGYRTSDMIGH